MQTKSPEEKIKKQKITIIILSVLFVITFITNLVLIGYYTNKEKKMDITLTDYYTITGSLYTYYEISIYCNINKTINVKDFTFKHNNENVCISKIKYNNVEYETDKSFVIYPKQENKLVLYISLTNDEVTNIYYKNNVIKLYNSISII